MAINTLNPPEKTNSVEAIIAIYGILSIRKTNKTLTANTNIGMIFLFIISANSIFKSFIQKSI